MVEYRVPQLSLFKKIQETNNQQKEKIYDFCLSKIYYTCRFLHVLQVCTTYIHVFLAPAFFIDMNNHGTTQARGTCSRINRLCLVTVEPAKSLVLHVCPKFPRHRDNRLTHPPSYQVESESEESDASE